MTPIAIGADTLCGVRTGRLKWFFGQQDHVVFNRDSGQMHLLNPFSAQALSLAEEHHSLSFACLLDEMAQCLERPADAALQENLRTLLTELDALGLIELTPAP